jgi:hypothetical protein
VNGASWQARAAVALLLGAIGEGGCVLLARYVAGGFVLATLVVSIALGWRLGPSFGGFGAGFPPLGLVFVSPGDGSYVGERILTVLTVAMLLGGSAWFTGRVRERYGKPPWGHFTGGSE